MTSTRIALAVALLAASYGAQAQMSRTPITPPAAPAASGKVYIVQLAAPPVATYTGGVRGLPATRVATGARLDMRSPAARAYANHLTTQRNAVMSRVGAKPLHTYATVFNGFAATLTDAQVAALMRSTDVKSVVESELRQLDTTRTPDFLGLSQSGGLWTQLDAQARNVKGEDVIIGVIDTGAWPEDRSFGDKVDASGSPVAYHEAGTSAYGPAPSKWQGQCQTGEGWTVGMCNNKLIGARFYVDAFEVSATRAALEYRSPRDGNNHGSHTASTAGGNSGVATTSGTVVTGLMSGVAPRARLAVYKVCWTATVSTQTGCYTPDSLRAIDDAVADGVDVINYSISGSKTSFVDPVEIAYLNAAAAGVFVAASAGNDGPGNEVAHISPWLTTVGASTHDRLPGAALTLGNGVAYTGYSNNFAAAPTAGLVLSNTIPAAGQTEASANTCLANSLSAAAAGKIVVCDRGTNSAAARLAASAEVKRVGGVGMVLVNPTNTTLVAEAHTVPTVHIQNTSRDAIRAYAGGASATGNISISFNLPGVVAPVMANFSSRGPNQANRNVLKPDITGPGVAIIAATRASLSQAQRDQVANGTLTPPSSFGSLQGTSMSSPHVAGAAALLRQLYPTWSPAAIKSALMTSTTEVKLSSGATDTNRWGYGAGHMNPNGAAVPSLVYDIDPADYGRFLCGVNQTPPSGLGTCQTLGTISPWNLNLPSLTAANVVVQRTLTRKVTNKGTSTATFVSNAALPGWNVTVTPASLTLAPGASATFTAELVRASAALESWSFGTLSWSDGVRTTTSPLSAMALALATPGELNDVRAGGKGTKTFNIESSYTGPISISAVGLVPAIVNSNVVPASVRQCYNFTVPAGQTFVRFATFNSDTQGGSSTDLDLEVFNAANGGGTNVGTSATGTSDEMVTLNAPAAGTYSACVTGYAVPAGGAAYALSTWIVGPGATPTLRVAGPSTVYERGGASVSLGWNVTPGARYMGQVQFFDGNSAALGSTKVTVDNR